MDKEYLVDTNILIYYFADATPKKELNRIEKLFMASFNISIITKIEFLGWEKHTETEFENAMILKMLKCWKYTILSGEYCWYYIVTTRYSFYSVTKNH